MRGKIIKDWSKVNFRDPDQVRKFYGAIQHFLQQPERYGGNPEIQAAMQHFTTKGDFSANILQVLEKYHIQDYWDNGYESIFDIRDFTMTNASGFDILDVEHGLAFNEVPVGGKAKLYKFSGSKTSVSFVSYGAGLQWDRVFFQDSQYWTLEDNAIAFRNAYFKKRAAVYYALLEAAANAKSKIAWQTTGVATTDALYNAIRDAKTINKACETILLAVKDKGYSVTPMSQFVVLAPIQLKERVNSAMKVLLQDFPTSEPTSQYNVRVIYSLMLASSTQYEVILPGIKLKGGYRQNLSIEGDTDILANAEMTAGWGRYGGAVGDTDQIERCAIS